MEFLAVAKQARRRRARARVPAGRAALLGSTESTTASKSAINFSGAMVSVAQSATPFPARALPTKDTGTEHHAFSHHLVDPAVDQPLFHLEVGLSRSAEDRRFGRFLEHRDLVPGAGELLAASEPRRTGAHYRDFPAGLVRGRLRPYPAFLERPCR